MSAAHSRGWRPDRRTSGPGNRTRSKVRARVEHVFGAQTIDMGGTLLHNLGIGRAEARLGLKTLAYTVPRTVQLNGLATARAPT